MIQLLRAELFLQLTYGLGAFNVYVPFEGSSQRTNNTEYYDLMHCTKLVD